MIWWILIIAVAGVATCPIMFAGWWTQRGFRVCCYLAIAVMIGIIGQAARQYSPWSARAAISQLR
jgi:hypothetical protein